MVAFLSAQKNYEIAFSFLGHLHLQSLIPIRIVIACVGHLLKTVTDRPKEAEEYRAVSSQKR